MARRFFAGDTTTDGHRTKVFEDVASALVEAGVVTTSELLHREDVSRALEEGALRWDETVATSRWCRCGCRAVPGHLAKGSLTGCCGSP